MTIKSFSLSIKILTILLSGLLLYACNPQETVATSSPTTTSTTAAVTIETQSSDTPKITDIPTTPPQSSIVLVIPPEADPVQFDELTSTLSELAGDEGLDFELRSSFTVQDLVPSLRLLVAVPPDPGLAELARSAPQSQFLGIGIPDLEPAPNLSVIDTQGISPGNIGFLAGYLAAVSTPEWRAGTISVSDTSEGLIHRDSFLNGAVFFCGLCRQTYPPFNTYPMYVESSAASTPAEWQAVADILIDQAVRTAYISPGISDDNLLEYLAGAEVNLVGTSPPPPGLQDNWMATITGDIASAVETAWPDLIGGEGGLHLPVKITLTDINPELLSPGRQRLVDNLISELEGGFIDTGVGVPQDSP